MKRLTKYLTLVTAGLALAVSLALPSLASIASSYSALNGSVTVPAFTFTNDTDTGMYLKAVGTLAFAVAGAEEFYVDSNGITLKTGEKLRGDDHLLLETIADGRAVRVNVRNYTQATGDSIGMRTAPSQTVTTTGSVVGGEFSPRFSDAGGGTLIALKADPVVKDATTTRTISALRAMEINIDLPNAGSAYTFTNDVSAIRVFPDFGSGHTFSGVKAVLEMAAPNTSNFDVLIESESGNATWIVVSAGTYSTADGYMLIRHAGSTYRVPFFAAVD